MYRDSNIVCKTSSLTKRKQSIDFIIECIHCTIGHLNRNHRGARVVSLQGVLPWLTKFRCPPFLLPFRRHHGPFPSVTVKTHGAYLSRCPHQLHGHATVAPSTGLGLDADFMKFLRANIVNIARGIRSAANGQRAHTRSGGGGGVGGGRNGGIENTGSLLLLLLL